MFFVKNTANSILLVLTISVSAVAKDATPNPTDSSLNDFSPANHAAAASATEISIRDYEADEYQQTANITLELSAPSTSAVLVNFSTTPGTALAGQDFYGVYEVIEFQPGETTKQVPIVILNDTSLENDEAFTATIWAAEGNDVSIARASAEIIIFDDDGNNAEVPAISVSSASISENAESVDIEVSLSVPATREVTALFTTTSDGATPGQDYYGVAESVRIAKGEQDTTVTITLLDDQIRESSEGISISLLNISGAASGATQASLTLIDDDDSSVPDGCVSFSQIRQNAPVEYCLATTDEHLGEFLRQRPDVSWWNIDEQNSCISQIEEPSCARTIDVSPTGGTDNAVLLAAIQQAGSGGCVDGGGQNFRINPLVIKTRGVTLKDMNLKAEVSSSVLIDVRATDVSFIRAPVDLDNRSANTGVEINATAHRFAMVEGGVSNQKGHANGRAAGHALVALNAGVNDVYIVNNEFKNSVATTSDDRFNSTVRGIHYNGVSGKGNRPSPGVIASNLFQNLQATRMTSQDADAFVIQGWESRDANGGPEDQIRMTFTEPVKFLANTGIDAGKRMAKIQAGSMLAHGNFTHFKTANGDIGRRKTATVYALHGVSNNSVTNNSVIADEVYPGGWTMFSIEMTHYFYQPQHRNDNNTLSCNVFEYNSRDTSTGGYFYRQIDFCDDGTTSWSTNSKVTDNHIRGAGIMDSIYWFQGGSDDYGAQFDHSGNTVNMETTFGEYRVGYQGSPARPGFCSLVQGR